jgi:hypothetical protein
VNAVPSQTATIRSASRGATIIAPMTSTLLSLLAREISARNRSWHSPARIPSILLQAIASPPPVPPITMPRVECPDVTCWPRRAHSTG